MNTEALERIAARKPTKKQEWRPPCSEDFMVDSLRSVIAVDPSLRKCAAVFLTARRHERGVTISVLKATKFATAALEDGGYEESLHKALELSSRLTSWIAGVTAEHHYLGLKAPRTGLEIVHEAPPIGGGVMLRPESSLLAGMALRVAARDYGLVAERMVAPQSHKRFICGNSRATKIEHHVALKRVAADLGMVGFDLITNEDLRDALSLALLHLTRKRLP